MITQALDWIFGETDYDLSIALVKRSEIIRINETFLQHEGATDVITFGYSVKPLLAEIVICLDEALSQSRRFATTWQSELARYIVHALLHLKGYDDDTPANRRRMKQIEQSLLTQLTSSFDLKRLGSKKNSLPRRLSSVRSRS
jgi:probable rRNA maturation factor